MKQAIWEYWKTGCGWLCIIIPLCVIIFGGEVKIHITWSTLGELWDTIMNKDK